MQEVNDGLADLLRWLPQHWAAVADRLGDNDILYRSDHHSVVSSFQRDLIVKADHIDHRHANVATLRAKATGAARTVVNFHLPSSGVGAAAQREAWTAAVKLLNELDGPLIVLGDLNSATFSAGYPHQRLRDEAGITWMTSKPTDPRSFAEIGSPRASDGKWLDGIGVRDLSIKTGGVEPVGANLSDHWPLIATVL